MGLKTTSSCIRFVIAGVRMKNIFIKKKFGKQKRILAGLLCLAVLISGSESAIASKLSDAKDAKAEAEQDLNEAQEEIDNLKAKENALQAEINAIDDELALLIVNMNILEQEIADKTTELEQVTADLAAAEQKQKEQYESMKLRIKYMYENGDSAIYEAILGSDSMAEMLNRVEYVNDVYEYDRNLLTEYEETVKEVEDLKVTVETEKAEMEAMQSEYEVQKESLDSMLAAKTSELQSADSLLANAKAKAAEYQATIEAQNKIIKEEQKKAEEAAKKKAEEEAKKAAEASKKSSTDSGSSSSSSGSSSGSGSSSSGTSSNVPVSGSGSSVVDYACQFIGNPYVWGGTSLTNGADCSGFVMSVYAHFGVSLPHSSAAMQGCGTGVSYSDAAPGDLICYSGHVAIYMGGGRIVHAQSAATGITTSSATYRTIIAVRRVI